MKYLNDLFKSERLYGECFSDILDYIYITTHPEGWVVYYWESYELFYTYRRSSSGDWNLRNDFVKKIL